MRRQYPEDALQIASHGLLVRHLKPGVIYHHSGNERRGLKDGAKQKAKGQRAGWHDWVIMWGPPVQGLFIELKHGRNDLTKEQEKFRDEALAIGCQAEAAWTLEEFVAILKKHQVPTRIPWPRFM